MTEEVYQSLKTDYIEFITNFIKKYGGLTPGITALGTRKDNDENAVVHVVVDSKFLESDDAKDHFVDHGIPQIAKQLSETYTVKAVAWASEAWLRVLDKKDAPELLTGDWKKIPIEKEVLIITIDSEKDSNVLLYEILRKGKQVTSEGELVDHIELVETPEYAEGITGQGRFTGLYKKFAANT